MGLVLTASAGCWHPLPHEPPHSELQVKDRTTELRQLSRAIEQSPSSVVITDLEGRITFVNKAFCRVSGYEEHEALGQNPRILKSEKMPNPVYEQLWQTIKSGKEWRGELLNRRRMASLQELAVISGLTDDSGNVTHFIAVKEDITDRIRDGGYFHANSLALEGMVKELEEMNLRAEAATRAKSEFLANMSHEIRTPMTAILGYADILAESLDQPEQQEAVQTIKRNGHHLLSLINDILDLSKIEAGKLQIEACHVSHGNFGDVVSLMRVRAEAKGLP